MIDYTKEDVKKISELMEITEAKAKKYIKESYKDLTEMGDEVTMEDIFYVAEIEAKEKKNHIRTYVQSSPTKKATKPREKKVDKQKAEIIKILHKALTDNGYGAIISNVDKAIDFDNFTVTLTKHRPPKK